MNVNKRLYNLCSKLKNTTVIKASEFCRECYTRQGFHLNNLGRRKISELVFKAVTNEVVSLPVIPLTYGENFNLSGYDGGVSTPPPSSSKPRNTIDCNPKEERQNLANEPASQELNTKNPSPGSNQGFFQLQTLVHSVRSNPTSAQYVTIGDASTLGSFSSSRATKFAIHGWMANEDHLVEIRDGWIQGGDYNIIMVDWSGPAGNLLYKPAADCVPDVGAIVARFVDFLVQQGASAADMELVGHSLGAHIAGVTGNRAAATIGRITALDPAAPLFGDKDAADRVDSSDASFVQVIHTSIMGWVDPLGHADFFPNGGLSQEGCGIDAAGSCSHSRSHDLYAESITSSDFVSYQCDSYDNYENGACSGNTKVSMGAPCPSTTSGNFYLKTAGSSPYALG